MRNDDRIRITHMVDAIQSALQFANGRNRQDPANDQTLLFALVRAVEIVGEAASKVSADARAETPQIPWGLIVGMRNRLIHAYFDIDPEIVWTTVTEALPALLPSLRGAWMLANSPKYYPSLPNGNRLDVNLDARFYRGSNDLENRSA